jgi:hypothetical protein
MISVSTGQFSGSISAGIRYLTNKNLFFAQRGSK